MLNKTQRPCKRLHLWRTREGPETVGGEASGPTVSNPRIVSLRYRLINKWLATFYKAPGRSGGGTICTFAGYTTTLQLGILRKGPERCWYRETPCKEM